MIVHLNWAQSSVKISPECINFSHKFQKFFWGGDPHTPPPMGRGHTPPPRHSRPSATRPSCPLATRSATQISPPQSFSKVGANGVKALQETQWIGHLLFYRHGISTPCLTNSEGSTVLTAMKFPM